MSTTVTLAASCGLTDDPRSSEFDVNTVELQLDRPARAASSDPQQSHVVGAFAGAVDSGDLVVVEHKELRRRRHTLASADTFVGVENHVILHRDQIVVPIAVVTGAARGIGAAISERLANDGFEVVRLDLDDGAGVLSCDVSNHAAVARIADDLGPIDVLVNNAGIWRFGPIETADPVDIQRVLAVNVGGTFNCTQLFGRSMLDRGGSIVNIVSIAAHSPNPMVGAYSASKSAVLAFTRQTAVEWGPRNVRANAVGPGFVPTPGTGDVYDDERVRAVRSAAVPLRRLGEPDDVANIVSFLSSANAAYVTGQVIYVDGGVTESLMTLIPRPADVAGPHLED
jgi:NAD(P)-dependent dehydrogenase (short-subunit alcohol dehydrogenase family)